MLALRDAVHSRSLVAVVVLLALPCVDRSWAGLWDLFGRDNIPERRTAAVQYFITNTEQIKSIKNTECGWNMDGFHVFFCHQFARPEPEPKRLQKQKT